MSVPEEVPEVPEVPEEVGEVPREVGEVPSEPPKRGRGRPRKDPNAPPKPRKQAVVQEVQEGSEGVREESKPDVNPIDNILYLFKQREIEEHRKKSEKYKQMLGL